MPARADASADSSDTGGGLEWALQPLLSWTAEQGLGAGVRVYLIGPPPALSRIQAQAFAARHDFWSVQLAYRSYRLMGTRVTMRSFLPEVTDIVAEYTSHFPKCHGGPLSKNDHAKLGIADPHKSFYPKGGHIVTEEGHDRLYWACGVTPSIVAHNAKLPLMIVHTPGHAMITDIETESLWQEESV